MNLKSLFVFAMLMTVILLHGKALAAFPDKTITLIVPISAGGGIDIIARSLVPSLEKELGVKVLVKNIPGGGMTLGAAEVSQAAPDGYILGYLSVGPLALQPHLRELPYAVSDFKPVACLNNTPMVLMVRGDSPMNTLADAKKFLLEKDGQGAFGSPAPGGLPHVTSVALFDAMGVKAKHIPDRSGAEVMRNLAGDIVQFYADHMTYLTAYDVKPLGIFAAQRHPDFPDIPTMKEQGYDFEFSIWGGIFVPQNTPDEIVQKLERAVRTAIHSPEFQGIAQKNKFTIKDMSSAEFAEFVYRQIALSKELIEKFNMKERQ